MNRPDTSLWTFCLSFYAFPQVESLCLELQDRGGMNVNSLLWAMWLDRMASPISPDIWEHGHDKTASWRRWIILPLRRLRLRLPKRRPWLGIRRWVQSREIGAEKRELEQLQQITLSFDAPERALETPNDDWYFLRQLLQTEPVLRDQLIELYESWCVATTKPKVG